MSNPAGGRGHRQVNCQGVIQRKPIYMAGAFGVQNTADSSGFDSHALDPSDIQHGCPRNFLLTLFKDTPEPLPECGGAHGAHWDPMDMQLRSTGESAPSIEKVVINEGCDDN